MLKKEVKRMYWDLPMQDATKTDQIKYLYGITETPTETETETPTETPTGD